MRPRHKIDDATGRCLPEGQHDDREYLNCGCGYEGVGDTAEKHDAYWAFQDGKGNGAPQHPSIPIPPGVVDAPDPRDLHRAEAADADGVPVYAWGDDGDHSSLDVPRGYHLAEPKLTPGIAAIEMGDASKKDDGKLRYDLIPPEALEELARVYTIGAAKYADNGWLNPPMRWGRIFRALVSHAYKWWRGERYDEVDGQHHLSSVAWCAFALMTYDLRGVGEDDRPKVPTQSVGD